MSDFALDPVTGDLAIYDGAFALVEDGDAIAQRLAIKLRTFFGEWFDDGTFGVPYRENVFSKPIRPTLINATFVAQILGTPGVAALAEPIAYDFDTSLRVLDISFKVLTSSGDLVAVAESIP